MSKQPLEMKQLFAYIKNRLGYGSKPETSLYELVCLALERDGKPKPIGKSHRFWVDSNAAFLYSEVSKFRREVAPKQSSILARKDIGKKQPLEKRDKKSKNRLKRIILSDPIAKQIINKQAQHLAQKMATKPKPQFKEPPAYTAGMGKDFYQTRQWRELRYKVLVKYGKVCQCCGEQSGYIHVDHIKPRSLFPLKELDINNLQVLCEACNIGKTNRDITDWRQK